MIPERQRQQTPRLTDNRDLGDIENALRADNQALRRARIHLEDQVRILRRSLSDTLAENYRLQQENRNLRDTLTDQLPGM